MTPRVVAAWLYSSTTTQEQKHNSIFPLRRSCHRSDASVSASRFGIYMCHHQPGQSTDANDRRTSPTTGRALGAHRQRVPLVTGQKIRAATATSPWDWQKGSKNDRLFHACTGSAVSRKIPDIPTTHAGERESALAIAPFLSGAARLGLSARWLFHLAGRQPLLILGSSFIRPLPHDCITMR